MMMKEVRRAQVLWSGGWMVGDSVPTGRFGGLVGWERSDVRFDIFESQIDHCCYRVKRWTPLLVACG